MLLNFALSAFTDLPGVFQAAIADDSGRQLDCAGQIEPPSTAMLVLADATLAAAAELGRHSGNGNCHEIIQQHENGVLYLFALPQRRLLLVRCQNADTISAVRQECQRLIGSLATAAASKPTTLDLTSALHAEPTW